MANFTLSITTTNSQDSGLQYLFAGYIEPQAANPGSGYVVGDVLTVVGGTGTASTHRVTSAGLGGSVVAVAPVRSGEYTVQPSWPALTIGGTGTGCRLRSKYANHTEMLVDFVTKAIQDYRRQWKDAQRASLAAGVDAASNVQLNNAATALGVILP
jgi:hypothetical protein